MSTGATGGMLFLQMKLRLLSINLNMVWAPSSSRIQQKSQCYNPKLQIWGSIRELGKVHFTFYESSLTSSKYVEILGSELLPEARKLLGKNWILQQDGARAHTANHSMNFLKGRESSSALMACKVPRPQPYQKPLVSPQAQCLSAQ